MHHLLLPGSHPLRRADSHLQVGLRAATVLPGPPRRLSELVADFPAMSTLVKRGQAAADDRPLRSALPPHSAATAWPRHTLAALGRRAGATFTEALAERDRHAFEVHPFGHPMSHALAGDLELLCRRSGLSVTSASRSRRSGSRPPSPPVAVLVGVGEPRRDLLDGWVRDGRPHLVVRLVEGVALLGPLVEPGRTACLRCTDGYLAEEDPSWPLLVEQYARASSSDRADGIPEPVDAALAALAVAWAVRDLATYAESGTPTTWSSTVQVSADLGAVETRTWPVHPHCGCGWD